MAANPMATPATLLGLPEGADGTRETLKLMRDLVRAGKIDPTLREYASNIVRHCPPKDDTCEVESLWRWVLTNIRYLKDIAGVETVHPPWKVLEQRYGDCDDSCTLLATFLETIGYKTRFVALGYEFGQFVHVIIEVRWSASPTGWKALDPTEDRPFGWRPPDMPFSMIVHN